MSDTHDAFTAAVLETVDRIPRGRVMTYGSIAEYLGRGGPRGVGGVLARHGRAVAWWRVVRADGALPAHLMIEAQQHWHREGTPLRRGIVHIEPARWWPDLQPRSAGDDQPPSKVSEISSSPAGGYLP